MTDDKYNLSRFVDAQEDVYKDVIKELKNAQKTSHWIWFIFPQLKGLGRSYYSDFYGIKNIDEARAYSEHKTLWARYLECCNILLGINGYTIYEIMGFTDGVKLQSSLTLFYEATKEKILNDLLTKYYGGEKCFSTLKLLKK